MKAVDYKCPSCNAVLKYNPKDKNWKCEYCGTPYTLEDLEKNAEHYEESKASETNEVEMDEYSCPNCGALIVADSNTAATFCVYCKNTAILKSRLTSKFAPEKVIPFSKTKQDAIDAFRSLSKGKKFMPKEFTNKNNINDIKGVYIPFWLYSCKGDSMIKGEGTKVSTWTTFDYKYTKTDTYEILREKNIPFNYIPTDGSTRFDDAIMNSIEPFNYDELIDFNYSYLSGFLAEKYDVEKETAKQSAITRAKRSAIDELMRDISYSSFEKHGDSFKTTEESFTYALLPVYMLNIKYNGKMYPFAMNGETGKMIGNIPYSKGKAFKYYLTVMLISFAILCLISYLL